MCARLLFDKLFYIALFAGILFWLVYGFLFAASSSAWHDLNILKILSLTIVFPLLEEATFRGLLQSWLLKFPAMQRRILSFSIANGITSLVFSAAHMVYQPVTLALAVFFPSLIFGFFRDRYHSILPGYLLHSFYNAGFYALLWIDHMNAG